MPQVKSWKERIQALVDRYGSRETVAAKLGVSYWTVTGWLVRDTVPSLLARRQISDLESKK